MNVVVSNIAVLLLTGVYWLRVWYQQHRVCDDLLWRVQRTCGTSRWCSSKGHGEIPSHGHRAGEYHCPVCLRRRIMTFKFTFLFDFTNIRNEIISDQDVSYILMKLKVIKPHLGGTDLSQKTILN